MTGRDLFAKNRILINLIVKCYKIIPKKFRVVQYNMFRNIGGKIGIAIRYVLLKSLILNCGDNVSVQSGVYIFGFEYLSIGNNVSIHPMSYIDASGGITIGNDVSIAHGSTIMSTTHTFADMKIPIKYQQSNIGKVTIKDNVWIGAKTTILCGKVILSGSVIGANSVITKNVEENVVVCGVPAKVIRKRGEDG